MSKITVITNNVKTSQNFSVANRVAGRVSIGSKTKNVEVRTIPGFSNYYANITTGQIYGIRGRSIGTKTPGGYIQCMIKNDNGEWKHMLRSRLIVMAATNSVIEDNMEVDHINNIKHDDRIENLAKCDHKSNCNNKLTRTLANNKSRKQSCDKLVITGGAAVARPERTYKIEKAK